MEELCFCRSFYTPFLSRRKTEAESTFFRLWGFFPLYHSEIYYFSKEKGKELKGGMPFFPEGSCSARRLYRERKIRRIIYKRRLIG